MSQAPSLAEKSALQIAEWKAEAALKGEPWYRAMVRGQKATMPARKLLEAADVWDSMGDQVRDIIIAMATTRTVTASSWRIRWDQLNEVEQIACGVLARELHRKTAGAEVLR